MSGSAPGRVEFEWGDGRQSFFLGLAQLEELQAKTGVGPEKLFNRLADGGWMVSDIAETIRLGLIGGGLTPAQAHAKVKHYCYPERPLHEGLQPAMRIVMAALHGPEDDKVGKAAAEKNREATETPTDA